MTKPEQLPFDLGHHAALGREDFFVSASNRDALAWIDRWPDWPAPLLIVYGPPASGKTHLLKVWRGMASDPARRVAIDNADFLTGEASAEKEIFHLYNTMKEKGGHLLVTASRPPREWNVTLPDLKSRLLAAPAVALGAPDEDLMAAVMTKLFSDRQLAVPQEVIGFVLPRIERSFAALRDLAEKIDRKALSEKRPVTIPFARELLQEKEL